MLSMVSVDLGERGMSAESLDSRVFDSSLIRMAGLAASSYTSSSLAFSGSCDSVFESEPSRNL